MLCQSDLFLCLRWNKQTLICTRQFNVECGKSKSGNMCWKCEMWHQHYRGTSAMTEISVAMQTNFILKLWMLKANVSTVWFWDTRLRKQLSKIWKSIVTEAPVLIPECYYSTRKHRVLLHKLITRSTLRLCKVGYSTTCILAVFDRVWVCPRTLIEIEKLRDPTGTIMYSWKWVLVQCTGFMPC